MDTKTKRDSRDHYEGGGTTTPQDANPQISRRTHTGSTTHIQQDPTIQGTPLDTSAMTMDNNDPNSEKTHPRLQAHKDDTRPHLFHTNKQGSKEGPSPGATTLEQELIPGTPQAHPNNVQTTIRGKRETPITGNTTHVAPIPPMITIGSSEDSSDDDVVEMTVQDDQRGTPLNTSITSTGNNDLNSEKTHPHPYMKERETNPQIIHTNTGTNKQKYPIVNTINKRTPSPGHSHEHFTQME